jgi:hypothetical protein
MFIHFHPFPSPSLWLYIYSGLADFFQRLSQAVKRPKGSEAWQVDPNPGYHNEAQHGPTAANNASTALALAISEHQYCNNIA